MDIIGQQSDQIFILLASKNELAQILGFPSQHASQCPALKVGDDIKVDKIYAKVKNAYGAKDELLKLKRTLDEMSKNLTSALEETSACIEMP